MNKLQHLFITGSKGNSYVLMWMCLLTNYPIAIPIPDKTAVTVVQAYLHNMYGTLCS